ncbi:MAG: autotransporter-associated beta strand repeat-containing protein, partial [Verrucomicrobiae bacterium]|nr:autotransporter-associated beta strand repeat-containing protein [Verrucomicrobiae bacterium]
GILGPWAFAGDRYATLDGSNNVVGFTGGTAVAAFGWTSSNPATFNYDVAGVQGALGVSRTANTARYTGGAGTQTWGNSGANVTITLNGLTNAGSGTLTFAKGGTGSGTGVAIGATQELVLNAASAGIAISAPIFNNGAGASALTVLGSAGVTLSGANAYTGGTTIGSGTLTVAGGNLGTGGIHVSSGASLVHTSSQTISQAVTGSGTISANSGTATLTGDFSGFEGVYIHNSSVSSTVVNSTAALSGSAAYHIAAPQGSLQGLLTNVTSGDNTFHMGALSGVANSLVRNGGSVTGNTTLVIGNLGTDTEFAGIIGGGGGSIAIEKVGSGELTLSGASTYTGDTLVSAGTLFVSGSLGATDVTVDADATIGGGGSIGGSLTFNSGSKLIFSTIDSLTVNGSSVSFGGFDILDLVGLSNSVATGTYTLIDGAATVDLTNVSNVGVGNAHDLGGGKFAYFEAGSLNLVVIPEPSAALLGGLGILALLRRRR